MTATLLVSCPKCGGHMSLWEDCFKGEDQSHGEWHCLLCGAWWADEDGVCEADFEAFRVSDAGGEM